VTDRARTVFLGSGDFAVAPAQATLEHPAVDLVAVVTAPPRPAGRAGKERPTPIARWAVEHGLPTLTPARLRSPESVAALAELQPELLVLADYGQIVPAALLDLPAHGALNLHPSLLPRWRGASPIPAAILAGDERTGVSLMLMDAGLDTGPLVAQRDIELAGDEIAPALEKRLSAAAADLLSATLGDWLAGALFPRAQSEDGVTLTHPLRRQDGRLDPDRPAAQLERQVRAYQPWPGSFLEVDGGRLVVWKARAVDTAPEQGLGLQTSDGVLELVEVQPAGGRRMSAADYARGRPNRIGSLLNRQ
jgi:methionyl-tRNA formyltransferase